MTKTYEVKTVVTVTQEQVDDFLSTAFEGGITYWANKIRVKKGCEPEEDANYMSDALTRGGTLQVYDRGEFEWYNLTLDDVLVAIGKCKIDFEQYDSLDADRVIQTAIFGEVVYG